MNSSEETAALQRGLTEEQAKGLFQWEWQFGKELIFLQTEFKFPLDLFCFQDYDLETIDGIYF